jgi:hypothetical protein
LVKPQIFPSGQLLSQSDACGVVFDITWTSRSTVEALERAPAVSGMKHSGLGIAHLTTAAVQEYLLELFQALVSDESDRD